MITITRPVDWNLSRLKDPGEDAKNTVLDPRLKDERFGKIHLPIYVLTPRGIYLEEEVHDGTSRNNPADREKLERGTITQELLVPYIKPYEVTAGVFLQSNVIAQANTIMEIITAHEVDTKYLRGAVEHFYRTLAELFGGHGGLLPNYIIANRCTRSVRGVATTGPELGPREVGVPYQAAVDAEIGDGEIILLARQPDSELHEGGILVTKARVVSGYAIRLHPTMLKALGCDHDGDEVSVFAVPAVTDELLECFNTDSEQNGAWSDECLMYDSEEQINLDELSEDTGHRLRTTGITLGPRDLLDMDQSTCIHLMSENGVKATPADTMEWVKGADVKTFCNEGESAVIQEGRRKLEVGAIGSLTSRTNQILYASKGTKALRDGLRLKKKLVQMLMDARHGEDLFDTQRVSEVFERRGRWKQDDDYSVPVTEAIAELASMGIKGDSITEILMTIWECERGVTEECCATMPVFATTFSCADEILTYKAINIPESTSVAGQVLRNLHDKDTINVRSIHHQQQLQAPQG